MRLRLAVLSFITLLCMTNMGMCAIIYNVGFDQASLTLTPGGTATLNVYLDEVVSDGSQHRLHLTGGTRGLIDGSFQAVVSGTGSSTISAGTGNAGFDFIAPIVPGTTTTVTQSILANNPVLANDIGSSTYRVQLGTITVAAGIAGDTNTLSLESHPVNSITIDDGFGGATFVINAPDVTFGSLNINVSAVPEPSLGLLGLIGIAALRRRQRKVPK